MKKKKNLVSIIVNCFNGEKFLREALNSVVNQTYKNWELIFCDNQSSDKSKEIFYSFKNKKFKYFKTKKFLNLYEARNFAITKSKGSFISFIDVDDLWHKKKLEWQLKLFLEPAVAVVFGNLLIKKNKKKKLHITKVIKDGYIYDDLIKDYNIGIVTSIIRKKILYKEKIFFNKKYNIIGDFDFFLRLSKKYIFRAIQFPVATYRIHKNNLSLKKNNLQVNEFKSWLKKNKKKLNFNENIILKNKILNLEFISTNFNKNFLSLLMFFLFNLRQLFSLKNIIILICPNFLLKKIMWFV